MTQINQNTNINMPEYIPNRNVKPQVRIPEYYYAPEPVPTLKERIEENPMTALPYQIFIKPIVEHPLYVIPTWLLLNYGFDSYAKACGGKYENSLVYKAAKFGDKIEQSRLIQNKPVQSVMKSLNNGTKSAKKLASKSAILRAMKETPSMPEWEMVKSQMFNQKQEIVQEFLRITDTLKLSNTEDIKLKNLGITKQEKEMLKRVFNVSDINKIPQEKITAHVLLERLGRSQEEINKILAKTRPVEGAKEEILKEMGLSAEKLKLIKEDMHGKYIKDVEIASKKIGGKLKVTMGHFGWMGPVTKLFERSIGCDSVYNKLHSLSDGAKTATGRFISKTMQMAHRALTFAGGKLGLLVFIAPILVETGFSVKKADKDQKAGTTVHGVVDHLSWVVTFPLALKIMHSFGGIQYAGMGKDKVEQYRKLLNDFKLKSKNDGFKSFHEYKTAKKELKTELKKLSKVKGQNIFTKAFRKLVRVLTMDLETIRGYKGISVKNFLKNVGGVPLRFVLWSAIAMFGLDAAISKVLDILVGKSYDAAKEDERKDNIKKQKRFLYDDLNQRILQQAVENSNKNIPAVQTAPAPKQNTGFYSPQNQNGANLISRGRTENSQLPNALPKEKVDNYTYIPSEENVIPKPVNPNKRDNYTYIPSSENVINSDGKSVSGRKYIPSQRAANLSKEFDNSGLDSALARADKAEENALKILSGNFEGMQ